MDSTQRTALMRSLVVALLKYESIKTTLPKAKETRRLAERMITWGTRLGDLLVKDHGDLSVEDKARMLHAKRKVRSTLGLNPTWQPAEDRTQNKQDALEGEGPVRAMARDSLDVVDWLFTEIAPRFVGRPGGYTRIRRQAKLRAGDASPMAILQLLPNDGSGLKKGAKGGKAAGAAETKAAKGGKAKAAKAEAAEAKPAKAPAAKKTKAKKGAEAE
jgi:large subunit ribosomal protein L17